MSEEQYVKGFVDGLKETGEYEQLNKKQLKQVLTDALQDYRECIRFIDGVKFAINY